MNHPPYRREEAEEMAREKYPIADNSLDPVEINSFIEGRMSLADKCREMESKIHILEAQIEAANDEAKLMYGDIREMQEALMEVKSVLSKSISGESSYSPNELVKFIIKALNHKDKQP